MVESGLVLTLTASLAAAWALGFVTQRLGLSPIIGYLLAGLIVGPYTPGFVADRELANEFAEVGIILLMFGVGLHFHVKDLLAVRGIAIPGALGQSAIATLLGAVAGRTFGWSWEASVLFGLALSVASTVMLTRVLADNSDLQTPVGRIAIGWLVVEDIFTIVVLVLLPAVFSQPVREPVSLIAVVALTLAKLVVLAVFAFVVGGRLIPRILNGVASTHSRELFTLTVLVLALGIAVGSSLAFGVSMALGAFLAGMIVGQSEFSFRAASDALPMRDAFAVLFFVSVGMLLDPKALMASPGLLLATLGIVVLAKPIAAFVIAALFGYGSKIAISVAIALAQIGEFSLILATVGDQLKILPAGASNLIIATAMISLALNPILYRWTRPLDRALARSPRVWRIFNWSGKLQGIVGDVEKTDPVNRTVIVGYGPIGQMVGRLLREEGVQPVLVEMNVDTARRLRNEGYAVVYGDATRPEVLEAAGIRTARALVISGPTAEQRAEIIRLARKMNPNIRVLVHSSYLRDVPIMRDAGADGVFSGEGEVALAMIQDILSDLGATPEQIDRERQRVHEEIVRISRADSQE
jgi:monovalent cation:H+ antiporter-2, CPA2 family